MNTPQRLFGNRVAISMLEQEQEEMDLREDFKIGSGRRLETLLTGRVHRILGGTPCQGCQKVNILFERLVMDRSIKAIGRCEHERRGGGQCPDGQPVGDYVSIMALDDDITKEPRFITASGRVGESTMNKEALAQFMKMATVTGMDMPGGVSLDDMRRELMSGPIDIRSPVKFGAEQSRDVPKTAPVEAW